MARGAAFSLLGVVLVLSMLAVAGAGEFTSVVPALFAVTAGTAIVALGFDRVRVAIAAAIAVPALLLMVLAADAWAGDPWSVETWIFVGVALLLTLGPPGAIAEYAQMARKAREENPAAGVMPGRRKAVPLGAWPWLGLALVITLGGSALYFVAALTILLGAGVPATSWVGRLGFIPVLILLALVVRPILDRAAAAARGARPSAADGDVLLLRPFVVDDAEVLSAREPSVPVDVAITQKMMPDADWEHVLVETLETLGPVRKIERPGAEDDPREAWAEAGGEDWWSAVLALRAQARLVVVVLGQSPGIDRELAMVGADLGRLVLLSDPRTPPASRGRLWRHATTHVPSLAALDAPDAVFARALAFHQDRDGMATFLVSERSDVVAWTAAFRSIVEHKLEKPGTPARLEPDPPQAAGRAAD